MTALICGSLAFDNIMVFDGKFADQILPNQLHNLNVSFYLPSLRREFGGCAGNIAYAMTLFGHQPFVMATLGNDGTAYQERLVQIGIQTDYIKQVNDAVTAQATIMTDMGNNQITAFHPGAMAHAHILQIPENALQQGIQIGIVSPDGRQAMIDHALQFSQANVPFIFDPGQGLPMFSGEELRCFIRQSHWVIVNDYESNMLNERTGLSSGEISTQVKGGLVVTLGEKGSEVWVNGHCHLAQPVKAREIVDPTGCGDAFRGALLHGLLKGWSLLRSAQLGNRVGAIKIAHRGGQNYRINPDELIAEVMTLND